MAKSSVQELDVSICRQAHFLIISCLRCLAVEVGAVDKEMVAFPINGSVMVNAVICQLADDGHKFNDFLGVYWHYLLVSQPLVSRNTSWIEDQCTTHQASVPHIIDNRMFHHLTIWGKSRNITDFLVRANDDLRWLSTDTDRDAARTGLV